MPGAMVEEFRFSLSDREWLLSIIGDHPRASRFITETEAALTLYFHLEEVDPPTAHRDAMRELHSVEKALGKLSERLDSDDESLSEMLEQAYYLEFGQFPEWTPGAGLESSGAKEHFQRFAAGVARFIDSHYAPRRGAPRDHYGLTLWRRIAYLYQSTLGEYPGTGEDSRFVELADAIAESAALKPRPTLDSNPAEHRIRDKVREARKLNPETFGTDPTELA